MSYKSVLQECLTKVSQDFPTGVSDKSVAKSVPQDCSIRVSGKSVLRVSYKSAPQKCTARVFRKSAPI